MCSSYTSDRIANAAATILRLEITACLYLSYDVGEVVILNALSDPT